MRERKELIQTTRLKDKRYRLTEYVNNILSRIQPGITDDSFTLIADFGGTKRFVQLKQRRVGILFVCASIGNGSAHIKTQHIIH